MANYSIRVSRRIESVSGAQSQIFGMSAAK
jgi:hypothetical protein